MDFSKACVIDIETNNLLSGMVDFTSMPYKLKSDAKLWCVVITNVKTREVFKAELKDVTKKWMKKTLKQFDYIIAHNGVKFDFIALKLFGVFDYSIGYPGQSDTVFGRDITFHDTLVMSRLLNPDRYGGHSLDAWGERTGNKKMNFRQDCIDGGYVDEKAPKGEEFRSYNPLMLPYCVQDTLANIDTFLELIVEMSLYSGWEKAYKMEMKLADHGIKRESLGYSFDKELAVECLKDLIEKMDTIEASINPILPPKPRNKGELKFVTPPATQLKKDGTPSANMLKFAEKNNAEIKPAGSNFMFVYKDKEYPIPLEAPLETHIEASIKDLDHIKMYLISLGWVPTEWRERDLTKDSKKQSLTYEKRIEALDRWYNQTVGGKYRESRIEIMEIPEYNLRDVLAIKLENDKPVRVPTSPCIRVGVEKELCPNLTKLGEKVAFAEDFALYLTYKHRKSSIAGGDVEDMDFDEEVPNTGFLANYREEDGRIPTPAIEIGAACVVEETKILTESGYKLIREVSKGEKIMTHNNRFMPVIDTINNGIKDVYEVELNNGKKVTCTENHPFLTTRGWVVCKDLEEDDEVFCINKQMIYI